MTKPYHRNAVRRVTRRFHALALEGAHGRDWYTDAAAWAERTVGPRAPLLLRLLAATSPRATITANVRHARRAFADIVSGGGLTMGYGVPNNDRNVLRVARGEPLGGLKVGPFAAALTGDPDAVPVDVWMVRASGEPSPDSPTAAVRAAVEAATRRVAKRLGWEPRQVQAAVWTAYRPARYGVATYAEAWAATA